MEIDYKKLVEQEEDFKQFISDVLFGFMKKDKKFDTMVKTIYSFYLAGTSVDEAVQIMSISSSLNNGEDDKNG